MRNVKHLFPILMAVLTIFTFAAPSFAENQGLLILPAGLTTIESSAFQNASSIERVIVPEGANTLESNAFAGSNLKQIQLPYTMNDIADDAFGDLEPLVVTVQYSTAYGWANGLGLPVLACTVNAEENRATIVSYNGSLSTLYLPDEVMGCPVTAIADGVFANNAALECVILPENLVSIGNRAFRNCAKLSDVVFNDCLTTINVSAFENCVSLIDADLPDSVQTIKYDAFLDCKSLTSFDFPTSWVNRSTDNDNIFRNCSNLKSIEVPEGMATLPISAFAGANFLEEIILPESLTSISNYAFTGASALRSIDIPASVETIGEYAFTRSGLESVTLPESLTTIMREGFSECKSLTDVAFNESLTTLCVASFKNCSALIEADLSDCVETIEYDVFNGCTALESFHYPTGWVSTNPRYNAAGRIFWNCTNLKSITVPDGITELPSYAFDQANYLEEIVLPSSLTSIPTYAFSGASMLKSIDIPASVETIGEFAFSGSGLESVTLPESLTTIMREGFSECKSLTDVIFNESLTTLCDASFMNCSALIEADLPDCVETIECDVFNGCTALESFHYPSSWVSTNPRYNAAGRIFWNCTNLKSITVPDGITDLPSYAFDQANYLEKVILPSSLTSIPESAFSSCSALGDTYIHPQVNSIHERAFENPGESLRILCEWGTTALAHAKEYNIPYYYLSRTGSGSLYGFYAPIDTIYKGDPVWMYGYVRSSIPVTSVTATLYDADGAVLRNVTVEPNVTDYNVGDDLASQFDFGGLELDSYSFKLMASTEESGETLVYNHFTVKEPPLRLSKNDISLPDDYYFPEDTLSLSGVIRSNYNIDKITVTVSPVSESEAAAITADELTWTAYPGSKLFDLSDVQLDLTQLGTGPYALRAVIESHQQRIIAAYKEFYITDYVNPDDFGLTNNELAAFLTGDFKGVLSHHFSYASQLNNAYSATLSWGEKLLNENNQFWKEWKGDIKDGIEYRVSGDTSSWNKVELYKVVISDFIKSTGAISFDKSFGDVVSQSIQNGASIADALSGADQFSISLLKFAREMDKMVEGIDFASLDTQDIITFADQMGCVAVDYKEGLVVLESLCTEIDPKSMDHDFQAAVAQMITAYERGWESPIAHLFNLITDKGVDSFIEGLLGSTLYVPFKIVSVADGILEAVGYFEGSEAIEAYRAKHTLYSNARDKYIDNFEAVSNGDHSEGAISRLLTSFSVTRAAALRELKAALDMEYSVSFRDDIREDYSYYQYLSIKDLV